jgi:Cu(I)/Ag(I) efflux system membrane fusion protein
MKRIIVITTLAVSVAAGAFAGGVSWMHRSGAAHAGERATVYTCPMHPDYHSDHPGDCPICGMHLERVKEGGAAKGNAPSGALSPGAVQVSTERQQAIGVRLGVVTSVSGTRMMRTTGRVAADENRTYPVIASVSGWMRKVEHVSTGDTVKAHQVLGSFVAPPEFDTAQRAYYDGLEKLYRLAATQPQAKDSAHATEAVERLADALRIMGVSNTQLRDMAKHRDVMEDILVEAPADGVVLKRSASAGVRFDAGFELYRIADLRHVWILADIYRDQLPFIRRGANARISAADGGRAVNATVSTSEPIFDETTLTLKVRLEAANPQLVLKPGMFVDVEFPIRFPAALVVPADAIVDSGVRKTVFVDRGNDYFEPRLVETGWRMGPDVEVTKGLAPGERIVVSGTFLIDSESRMKASAKP